MDKTENPEMSEYVVKLCRWVAGWASSDAGLFNQNGNLHYRKP